MNQSEFPSPKLLINSTVKPSFVFIMTTFGSGGGNGGGGIADPSAAFEAYFASSATFVGSRRILQDMKATKESYEQVRKFAFLFCSVTSFYL